MNLVLENKFATPLGIISCGLQSSDSVFNLIDTKAYKNGHSQIAETISHQVELVTFKRKLPLSNGNTVEDCTGWLWRINKLSNINESIQLQCLLTDYEKNLAFDIATGEHLDAIEVYTNDWTLHIGTEDHSTIESRAENDDWMPYRFKNSVNFDKPITQMLNTGFVTAIPDLQKGEHIQIHYLTAFDKRDVAKANTWLAVDESKHNLDKWIGL